MSDLRDFTMSGVEICQIFSSSIEIFILNVVNGAYHIHWFPCISGINCIWSWCIILLMFSWILFASILLRMSVFVCQGLACCLPCAAVVWSGIWDVGVCSSPAEMRPRSTARALGWQGGDGLGPASRCSSSVTWGWWVKVTALAQGGSHRAAAGHPGDDPFEPERGVQSSRSLAS